MTIEVDSGVIEGEDKNAVSGSIESVVTVIFSALATEATARTRRQIVSRRELVILENFSSINTKITENRGKVKIILYF